MNVSVVIASGAGGEFLFRCLKSLEGQAQRRQAEVIVVDRIGPARAADLHQKFPWVKVLEAGDDPRPSIPELRRMGVECAQGEIIAIIEEHCTAPDNWIETIENSFQKSDAAIGGPILDAGYNRLQDWVVYFSEYHNYLPPWQEGSRYLLNGANVAYHRQKLMKHLDVLDSGYWEVVLHPLLAKDGDFRAVPAMGVYHTGPFDYSYYLRQRYLLSRVWGGTQREKVSSPRRLTYLVAAPVFPPLLVARIAQRVFQCKPLISKFLATLPLLVPVTLAYVWGEWQGYLLGVGNALDLVE